MLKPPTHERTQLYTVDGHILQLRVLAYCPVTDAMMAGCLSDWLRSKGKKKLKTDMAIEFPTLYGLI